ncbi:MAG: 5-dehydro-4-deoxy-D-glucuronate isomerase [Bacillota bacterium]
MEIRYGINPKDVSHYSTKELREELIVENFFVDDDVKYVYTHIDRTLLGGAVPKSKELKFDDFIDAQKDLGAEFFLAGRELACINLGGDGYVTVDGTRYDVGYTTAMYIGMGSKNVTFGSVSSTEEAKFYFYSTPAHMTYETKVITKDMAKKLELGSKMECNERTIHQYIQPEVKDSCQVLLGYTQMKEGSVWNSMPTHTHERRSETYMYFNMKEEDRVVHLMGEPENTRHLLIHNYQAVISPTWSIHTGVGTGSYGFVWGMAGENKTLSDAEAFKISQLK